MTTFRLLSRKFFDGDKIHHNKVMEITQGNISAIYDADSNPVVDEIIEGLIVPGFIDLQVNGGGNVLFNTSPTLAGIKTIIDAHAQFGTTAILPTLITDTIETMQQAADAISAAIANNILGIIGVHFEGPHLSLAKKGAHIAEHIRPISAAEWQILTRKDLGQILVTLAPENVSPADINRMVNLGIKVCLGHSNADYKTTQQAIDAGADGFTHLYNAMSAIQGREPGVLGTAFLNDNTSCGLIVDGHHVDYHSCKIALKIKPQGKVFLVTDAMPPVGCDETEFALFNRKVLLENGKLTLPNGSLAGSALNMAAGVRNIHQHLDLSLEEALRMASLYPAQYINKNQQLGALAVGKQADMVQLNDALQVQTTWIKGEKVYSQ
ncbi:MAG: N-acetylglucosamine-6-phosphate deacetylase [Gammaproteobacteria bacterium]|nr:MAG: N-acetylglucosamine-6-phosphate deacetylase [Gammaproteobacteria bacterium]